MVPPLVWLLLQTGSTFMSRTKAHRPARSRRSKRRQTGYNYDPSGSGASRSCFYPGRKARLHREFQLERRLGDRYGSEKSGGYGQGRYAPFRRWNPNGPPRGESSSVTSQIAPITEIVFASLGAPGKRSGPNLATSPLLPKADIGCGCRDVRFVPKADIRRNMQFCAISRKCCHRNRKPATP